MSIARALAELLLATTVGDTGGRNRWSIDGLSVRDGDQGHRELRFERLEARHLQVAVGDWQVVIDGLTADALAASFAPLDGRLQPGPLRARGVAFSGLRIQGPWSVPAALGSAGGAAAASPASPSPMPTPTPAPTAAGAAPPTWRFEPLSSAEGALRAQIPDAHLMFDAEVTSPVRRGVLDFNESTVEHVGPDSRMGVSRLGIFVDAPPRPHLPLPV